MTHATSLEPRKMEPVTLPKNALAKAVSASAIVPLDSAFVAPSPLDAMEVLLKT